MKRILSFFLFVLLFSCSKENNTKQLQMSAEAVSLAKENDITTVIGDMYYCHEALPHGVPESYDWQACPRKGYGNKPPRHWRAFIAWGQLYETIAGNTATNTRVQIKEIEAWFYSKALKRWEKLQDEVTVEGDAYAEDFTHNVSKEDDAIMLADGSITVTDGAGYNFHFWP